MDKKLREMLEDKLPTLHESFPKFAKLLSVYEGEQKLELMHILIIAGAAVKFIDAVDVANEFTPEDAAVEGSAAAKAVEHADFVFEMLRRLAHSKKEQDDEGKPKLE